MVDLVDDSVGSILDALEAQGIAEKTVVVFTSDHGDWLGDHALFQKRIPHTHDLTRFPWIIRWPDVAEPGRRVTTPASQVDLVPTLLDAAGVEIPSGVQGASLRHVLAGDREALRPFAYVEHRHEAYRPDHPILAEWRLGVGADAGVEDLVQDLINLGEGDIHVKTVYADGNRLSHVTGVPEEYGELFDLEDDPGEIENLWRSDQELRCKMLDHLADALLHAQEPLLEREYPV